MLSARGLAKTLWENLNAHTQSVGVFHVGPMNLMTSGARGLKPHNAVVSQFRGDWMYVYPAPAVSLWTEGTRIERMPANLRKK